MKIKVLLVDDEERATDSLQLMINRFTPQLECLYCCNDVSKAAQMIHDIQPDLIFLDIRMPHMSGFELLNRIPKKNFKVIFTTAYDEYAIKAIRFSAFDYLLKPIDVEDLINAINRFLQLSDNAHNQQDLFNNFASNIKEHNSQKFRLALPSKKGRTVHFSKRNHTVRSRRKLHTILSLKRSATPYIEDLGGIRGIVEFT